MVSHSRKNELILSISGFIIGFILSSNTVLFAQSITVHADITNNCQWTQPASSLAEASAIKVQVTDNSGPRVDVQQICSGTGPFTCNFPIPLTMQSVGSHTLNVYGATVDPVDNSLTAYTLLVSGNYTIAPLPQPPAPGSNFKIIKIAKQLAKFFGF